MQQDDAVGSQAAIERARGILATTHPKQLEMHVRAPSGSMLREPAAV